MNITSVIGKLIAGLNIKKESPNEGTETRGVDV